MPSSVRLPPEIHEAARRVATAQDRSLSSFLVHVLRTWLTERGHLPKDGSRPKPRRAKAVAEALRANATASGRRAR